MALTFDESYAIIARIGKEVGQLVNRGDVLAMDLYRHYCDWHMHEFDTYLKGRPMEDTVRRRNVIAALEAYMQRDLTLHERDELAGKKGHLVEVDSSIPSNLVHLNVKRAIARGK